MDGTLKAMLERWAQDSAMKLDYRLPSDYSLYRGVSDIDTTSLLQAVGQVSTAYKDQRLLVEVAGNDIVVRRTE